MIALSIVCVIVIALLCIINRQSVPGLANILYAILGACLLALIINAFISIPSGIVSVFSATMCSAAVLAFVFAIGAFALIGYQNKLGDRILKIGYAVATVIVTAVAYYIGGNPAALGAVLGACVPVGWMLLPI